MIEFELDSKDSMGRVATLTVGGRKVTTPALMPVVNPHLTRPDLGEAQAAITNAYILHESDDHREEAVSEGVHSVLDFDGVVATDSGAYQMSVYGEGEVDVSNRRILEFQEEIATDVATPLDVPTPPDADREQTEQDLEVTRERFQEAVELEIEPALNAPVQGGLYTDIRETAAEDVYPDGDVYDVGAVVPLMTEYRYDDLVDVVGAAKRGLGADAPVHLFGAGHPSVFGLAAALGCDLFDSAAYALYAEDRRYVTVDGTMYLDDMEELPCSCSSCRGTTPDEMEFEELAQHNLDVSFAEIRRVREAIRKGELLEHVEKRMHAHPKFLRGLEALGRHVEQLERYDPASKGTFFYLGNARRPEVYRHHRRLERLDVEGRVTVSPRKQVEGRRMALVPPFGPVPVELRHTYPLNAEVPNARDADHASQETSIEGVRRLAEEHPDADVALEHPGWSHPELENLECVEVHDLSE